MWLFLFFFFFWNLFQNENPFRNFEVYLESVILIRVIALASSLEFLWRNFFFYSKVSFFLISYVVLSIVDRSCYFRFVLRFFISDLEYFLSFHLMRVKLLYFRWVHSWRVVLMNPLFVPFSLLSWDILVRVLLFHTCSAISFAYFILSLIIDVCFVLFSECFWRFASKDSQNNFSVCTGFYSNTNRFRCRD